MTASTSAGAASRRIATLRCAARKETIRLGAALAAACRDGDVLALVGPLGVGKTQLAKAIGRALGLDPREVVSPTFTLIRRYPTSPVLWHMDVYRLEDSQSFLDLGVDDFLGRDGLCVIEWADRVRDALPPSTLWVEMNFGDAPEERVIEISGDDEWLRRLRTKLVEKFGEASEAISMPR